MPVNPPLIETPLSDKRMYRAVRLQNELEVLLIQQPEILHTERTAISLSVNSGSFNDPVSLPGLAHLCEHLLFMGSQKYQSEDAYSNHLARGAGVSNAYTTGELTNFHFEINDSHLEDALDIFSQFFISPLFLKSCKDREVRAVDSEHKKNIGLDHRRFWQLSRIMANPNHPFSRFTTGDLQTLSKIPELEGIDVRDELIEYHSKFYSANRSKLVIASSLSLDKLQMMATAYFSAIPNKNLPSEPSYSAVPIFTPTQMQTIMKTVPIMATRIVRLDFPIPDKASHYKVKPHKYFSYLIGHEGPGSVYSLLKSKGWITSIYASSNNMAKGHGMFQIEVGLTAEGVQQYEEILLLLFRYIEFVTNETGIQRWIFDEIQTISLNEFTYKQNPTSLYADVAELADSFLIDDYPLEHIISGSYLLLEYNAKVIWNYGQKLSWNNFKVLLIAPELSDQCVSIEPYYKTEYSLGLLSPILIDKIRNSNSSHGIFELPEPNRFIPINFDLIIDIFKGDKASDHRTTLPNLIRRSEGMNLWYLLDNFDTPMGSVIVDFINPLAHSTPNTSVLTELFSELANEYLNQVAYSAVISGLSCKVEFSHRGFYIKIHGFNDKIEVLLQMTLGILATLEIDYNSFTLMKQKLLKKYNDIQMDIPFIQMMCITPYILDEKQWSPGEMSSELQHVTREELQAFIPMITKKCSLEVFVHGNFTKREALKIGTLIMSTTNPTPIPLSLQIDRRSYVLPRGKSFNYSTNIADHRNLSNAVQLYLQIGPANNIAIRALTGLLDQFLRNPAFYHLRSKEQLGYIVNTMPLYSRTMVGFSITVQTEKSPDFVEKRIEYFLKRMEFKLDKLLDTEFASYVTGFVTETQTKTQNLLQETEKIWTKFQNNFYDFTKESDECKFAKSIQKSEFIQFYKHYITPTSTRRAKLSIHMNSKTSLNNLERFVEGIATFLEANDINKFIISRTEIHNLTKDCILLNSAIEIPGDDSKAIEIDYDAAAQKIHIVLIDKGYTPEFVTALMNEGLQILASVMSENNPENDNLEGYTKTEESPRGIILLQPLELAKLISLSFDINGISDSIMPTIEIIEMALQSWEEDGQKIIVESFKAGLIAVLVQKRFTLERSREIVDQALSTITIITETPKDVSGNTDEESVKTDEHTAPTDHQEKSEPKNAEGSLSEFSRIIIGFLVREGEIPISKISVDDITVMAQKSVKSGNLDFESFIKKLGFYLIKKGIKMSKLQSLMVQKGHILQKMLGEDNREGEDKSHNIDQETQGEKEERLNELELFTKALHTFLLARWFCEPSLIHESSLLSIAFSASKKNKKQGTVAFDDKKFFKKLIKYLSKLGLSKDIIKGLQKEGLPSSTFFIEVSRARSKQIHNSPGTMADSSKGANGEETAGIISDEDADEAALFVQGIIVFFETKNISSLVQENELLDIVLRSRRNETHDIQPELFAEALAAYLILKGCDSGFVNIIMKEGLSLLSAMLEKNDDNEDEEILACKVTNVPITNLVKFRSELRLSIAAYPSKNLESYEEKATDMWGERKIK